MALPWDPFGAKIYSVCFVSFDKQETSRKFNLNVNTCTNKELVRELLTLMWSAFL